MGPSANVGQVAVAVGAASSSAKNGVGLGRDTVCGTNGLALGAYSNAYNNSVAVGYTSLALSARSNAVGLKAEAGFSGTSNESIALGTSAKSYGDSPICIGNSSTIPSTIKHTIVLGSD